MKIVSRFPPRRRTTAAAAAAAATPKHHRKRKTWILYVLKGAVACYVGCIGWFQIPAWNRTLKFDANNSAVLTLSAYDRRLETPREPNNTERDPLQQLQHLQQDKDQEQQQDLLQSPKYHSEEQNFLPRVLAFVFPQFHREELNDRLWGVGFTDWDNLRHAPKTNRLGYAIPRPTKELGYYDLTNTETRRKQGELARQYDLDGFIFHHYWFYDSTHPGPNLHKPLMAILKDGYPDTPFALHWCASKWVNTWSGSAVKSDFVFQEPGVLQKQYFPTNGTDPAISEHYQWLREFFHHPNYIKVDGGKPLFMVYQKKPSSFRVLRRLNELARLDGFPGLYLTVGLTMPHSHLQEISDPNQYDTPPQKFTAITKKYFQRPVAYPNPSGWNKNKTMEIPRWCLDGSQSIGADNKLQQQQHERVPDIAGIISSFDNTPRRNYEEAVLWSAEDPEVVVQRFQKSLYAALYYEACCFPSEIEVRAKIERDDDDRFVIINAWNEWAEGMVLEPSDVFGTKFLEAIRDAKQSVRDSKCQLRLD